MYQGVKIFSHPNSSYGFAWWRRTISYIRMYVGLHGARNKTSVVQSLCKLVPFVSLHQNWALAGQPFFSSCRKKWTPPWYALEVRPFFLVLLMGWNNWLVLPVFWELCLCRCPKVTMRRSRVDKYFAHSYWHFREINISATLKYICQDPFFGRVATRIFLSCVGTFGDIPRLIILSSSSRKKMWTQLDKVIPICKSSCVSS